MSNFSLKNKVQAIKNFDLTEKDVIEINNRKQELDERLTWDCEVLDEDWIFQDKIKSFIILAAEQGLDEITINNEILTDIIEKELTKKMDFSNKKATTKRLNYFASIANADFECDFDNEFLVLLPKNNYCMNCNIKCDIKIIIQNNTVSYYYTLKKQCLKNYLEREDFKNNGTNEIYQDTGFNFGLDDDNENKRNSYFYENANEDIVVVF